jgi:hypothetical protein
MNGPRPMPMVPNQGKSAPSTEDTPMVYATFPHDTFVAPRTPPCATDREAIGKGTKGSAPRAAANPVPQRCSGC